MNYSLLQADEEYFPADEFESAQQSHHTSSSFNTICNFKNTNEHICQLVIEILMDLSRRYIENKDQWDPELLTVLINRLNSVNKNFEDSAFLLKGFSPILSTNDKDFDCKYNGISYD